MQEELSVGRPAAVVNTKNDPFSETGIVVSDEEYACVKIIPATFHAEWNYAIHPKKRIAQVIVSRFLN